MQGHAHRPKIWSQLILRQRLVGDLISIDRNHTRIGARFSNGLVQAIVVSKTYPDVLRFYIQHVNRAKDIEVIGNAPCLVQNELFLGDQCTYNGKGSKINALDVKGNCGSVDDYLKCTLARHYHGLVAKIGEVDYIAAGCPCQGTLTASLCTFMPHEVSRAFPCPSMTQ